MSDLSHELDEQPEEDDESQYQFTDENQSYQAISETYPSSNSPSRLTLEGKFEDMSEMMTEIDWLLDSSTSEEQIKEFAKYLNIPKHERGFFVEQIKVYRRRVVRSWRPNNSQVAHQDEHKVYILLKRIREREKKWWITRPQATANSLLDRFGEGLKQIGLTGIGSVIGFGLIEIFKIATGFYGASPPWLAVQIADLLVTIDLIVTGLMIAKIFINDIFKQD